MNTNQNSIAPPPPLLEEEVHLSDYLAVLFRRRRIAVAAFLAVVLAVTLYTFLVHPTYEATATLHVRDEKVKGGANLLGDLGLSRDNPIETEIEIVKSRTNLEEVVRRMHLNWVVDKQADGLTFQLAEFTSTAEEPVYRLEVTGSGTYKLMDLDGQSIAEGRDGTLLRGPGVTLVLTGLEGEAGDSCRLTLGSFGRTVKGLREAIHAAEVGKGTNIIRISYQNHDPALARDVVNTLAQVYLERSILLKTEEASRSVEFIGEQLEKVRDTLEGAEANLESFKSEHGLIQLDSEAQSLITRLSDLEQQQTANRLQLRQAEFAAESLRRALERGESYAPAVLLHEPVVAALAQALAELEVEKQGLLVEFAAEHPAVRAVQQRIAQIQGKLLDNYQTILAGLREADRTMSSSIQRYEAGLKKLPAAELELARRTRLATVNAEIYTFLLQKQQEARIAKASTISNVNIIDPAIAAELPVKPRKAKNLLLGLIVGGMFGVGLAFFREYLDDTIKDPDTAKRLLGLPLLATIPYIGRKSDRKKDRKRGAVPPQRILIAHLEPRSASAEAFRSLRTALHFARKGRTNPVLMITSTFPGEGKTTVSANLAVTLAQTGSRVLLVGCDLRKPTLHEMFNEANIPGLSDCLVGDTEMKDVVRATGLFRLDFVSAGTLPPNPAELLGSERMHELVEIWRKDYDLVLLDAPPVLAVTDALVLVPFADLTAVVLEAGGVGVKAAQRTLEVLRSSEASLAGLIVNDKTNRAADEYHYGSYGHYASAYGNGYEELSDGESPNKDRRR
jgi:tyrosine-protein kinase Etk/Wzc